MAELEPTRDREPSPNPAYIASTHSYLPPPSDLNSLRLPQLITPVESEIAAPQQKSLSPAILKNALRESFMIIGRKLIDLWNAVPAPLPLKIGTCAAGAAGIGWLAYLNPAQTLGGFAGAAVIASMSFKDNHHIRAQSAVAQSLFGTHLAMLGAWPAVLQSSLSAVRSVFLGMVPEETKNLRVAAGVTGFAVASGIFATFFDIHPLLKFSNLPIIIMALTSAADAFPKKLSWATRACYLATAGALVPYHLLISGSWMGVAVNTFAAANLMASIYRNDIASKSESPTTRGV